MQGERWHIKSKSAAELVIEKGVQASVAESSERACTHGRRRYQGTAPPAMEEGGWYRLSSTATKTGHKQA